MQMQHTKRKTPAKITVLLKKKEVNRYCNREFLYPIREIDPAFYESIKIQSD